MPEPDPDAREDHHIVKLWTSTVADALYIEPIQALGLKADGVVTLQHALKRAIEAVFQVEPNEIGVSAMGDPVCPNILLYEAAEGKLRDSLPVRRARGDLPHGHRDSRAGLPIRR